MLNNLSPNAKKCLVELIRHDMVNGNGWGCKKIAELTKLQEHTEMQWLIRARYELEQFAEDLDKEG